MIALVQSLHPVLQALLGTCFTWGVTALGAATVFLRKDLSRRVLDGMLGFAGGVMIAASYWSLLAPAIEMAEGQALPAWFPATAGFLLGGAFLRWSDRGRCRNRRESDSALRLGLRGGRHDLRRHRGGRPGVAAGWQHRSGHAGRHVGVRGDDDAGRCVGLVVAEVLNGNRRRASPANAGLPKKRDH